MGRDDEVWLTFFVFSGVVLILVWIGIIAMLLSRWVERCRRCSEGL